MLGGCSNGNKIEEKDTSKNETIIKEEKELKFVVAPQYEGKTSDLIELGKKLTKEHPELGSKGNMAIYYTGAVSDGRAALMLVNKTDVDIKKDLEFSLSWSYDGKTIFDNQKISYTIKDSGELPSYTTTLILLPLNSEQLEVVDSMSEPSKMTLSMSDVKSVE
jgi:probable lipoprotein